MKTLIKNVLLVNEGISKPCDVLIDKQRIDRIDTSITSTKEYEIVEANGNYLVPGAIDDQVHFREPGLTHKATIRTESAAAVMGGVTSFMEMPNTVPPVFTQQLLAEKYQLASENSYANYSFYMGTSNDNYDEIMRTNLEEVCGLKIFMGSSTGNLLVDNPTILEKIFANTPMLIATHCEDENTIKRNETEYYTRFGTSLTASHHPLIRSVDACYASSSKAVALAQKHGTKLHVLHLSTAKELSLFDAIKYPTITAEACVHHLWFNDADYVRLGNLIKCNPAIKSYIDQEALWQAVIDDVIKVIATDHAPHTLAEKSQNYVSAPSGLPLVQHSMLMMLEKVKQDKIKLEHVIKKMCHDPAMLFGVNERGFVREGYYADLVVIDPTTATTVDTAGLQYHCAWSPLEGFQFSNSIQSTMVNGTWVVKNKIINNTSKSGMRLAFRTK